MPSSVNSEKTQKLKRFLDQKVEEYNNPEFIDGDPISIPHSFSLRQDIEISAFWTAMFSWGQRITIINKSKELFELMDGAPHDFILNHQEADRKRFKEFKHRTFNFEDTLCFLEFLQSFFMEHQSLEEAFLIGPPADWEQRLSNFHNLFFESEFAPQRTRKHVATPARGSTCKRLNMFLRWMVRKDDKGVDFGIWDKIDQGTLMCPLDVHVDRIARQLGLIERKQTDWRTVVELSENLRTLDPLDPVKYDFALFGIGVMEKINI